MTKRHIDELKDVGLYWDDEVYTKYKTILRFQYNGLFNDLFPKDATPMSRFEYEQNIDAWVNYAVKLAEDFSQIMRGIDKPLSYQRVKRW